MFGDGNDRYILTDAADGSNLLDIYGEFGVDGTGTAWEYTNGYAYRMPDYNSGNGGVFAAGEWTFGGVDSLLGDPMLMLMYTDPGRHIYNADCVACPGDLNGDNSVNLSDLAQLLGNYGTTSGAEYEDGDMTATATSIFQIWRRYSVSTARTARYCCWSVCVISGSGWRVFGQPTSGFCTANRCVY